MKTRTLFVASLLVAAATVQAQDLPSRRAGLWNMSMQMQGMPMAMNSQHCIDARSDAEMQRKALAGDPNQKCTQKSMKRTATGYEVEAECTSAEGKASIHSVASGDFNAAYSVDNKMRFDPPRHGMREAQMKITARHGGACPAGMAAGEVRVQGMPGGMAGMQGMSPEQLRQMAEEMQKAQGRK